MALRGEVYNRPSSFLEERKRTKPNLAGLALAAIVREHIGKRPLELVRVPFAHHTYAIDGVDECACLALEQVAAGNIQHGGLSEETYWR